jgi:fatty acid desaturase
MLVKKRIDVYPITTILLVFAIDLIILLLSPSALIPIIWMVLSLNVKGWICSWNHNHQHFKFFTVSYANRLIEFVMGLHTGIVGEAWVLHHTLGHHLNYLDQSKDESAWKTSQGRVMSRIEYTFKVGIMAYPIALKVGKQHRQSRQKLIQNMVFTGLFLAGLCWINWLYTLIIFIAPMIFLLFMVVYETYDHHAGLDQQNLYQASYNITDRWYNFFTCNLGYHTAHHFQCGRHWSQLPQLHDEIKDKIPSHLYRKAGFPFNLMTKVEQGFFLTPQR